MSFVVWTLFFHHKGHEVHEGRDSWLKEVMTKRKPGQLARLS